MSTQRQNLNLNSIGKSTAENKRETFLKRTLNIDLIDRLELIEDGWGTSNKKEIINVTEGNYVDRYSSEKRSHKQWKDKQ